jgi:beta-lactamase class A
LLSGAAVLITVTLARAVDQSTISQPELKHILAIERSIGGRLALAAIDTVTGKRLEYRATERLPDMHHI